MRSRSGLYAWCDPGGVGGLLLLEARVMALASRMFCAPRLRSAVPLSCRILDHLLWPAWRRAEVDIGALTCRREHARSERRRQAGDDAMGKKSRIWVRVLY